MTDYPHPKNHPRCVLWSPLLFALFLLAPGPGFSGDESHARREQAPKVQEQPNRTLDQDHGHDHAKDGGHVGSASPENNPTPEQMERMAEHRRESLAQARNTFRKMQLDPKLTSLNMAFDHGGQYFDMGMTLKQALIRVLAGDNRCRVTSNPDEKSACRLEIITNDGRQMSLRMEPLGDKLLIRSMTLTKLGSDGGIKQTGAKAAFYLMAFMQSPPKLPEEQTDH